LKSLLKRYHSGLSFPIVGHSHQHPKPPHSLALLRAPPTRPRGSRAAEQRDELAPLHSITSSASCWSCNGTSRPSALA
jgi:hypothetical protein